jgi:hypothetical protein
VGSALVGEAPIRARLETWLAQGSECVKCQTTFRSSIISLMLALSQQCGAVTCARGPPETCAATLIPPVLEEALAASARGTPQEGPWVGTY